MKRDKGKEKKRKGEFEFCKVCRINHDDGRRHNYFPSHTKSLSSFFSRFQKKVSDVLFSLKSPKFIQSEHASSNRIWCVFCEMDVDELGSLFESGNAIRHLASKDHLKNLKHFLWKYGGGMNKVDSFRVSETEVSKWEKKCEVLQSEPASTAMKTDGSLHRSSTDIQTNHKIMEHLDKNNFHFIHSSLSSDVMPLQYNTNENYQVSHSDMSGVADVASSICATSSPLSLDSNAHISTGFAGYWNGQYFAPHDIKSCFSHNCTNNERANGNQAIENRTSSSQGFQNLTQVSARGSAQVKGNVHTGAPPPWFDSTEAECNFRLYRAVTNTTLMPPSKSGKLSQSNPKRVGAAWAEKRKIEMERERRGEIITNVGGDDWLPNFGRVWQAGSRKNSKMEFEKEKRKLPDIESHSEALMKIQPYISKRMRSDTNKGSSDRHAGNTADVL